MAPVKLSGNNSLSTQYFSPIPTITTNFSTESAPSFNPSFETYNTSLTTSVVIKIFDNYTQTTKSTEFNLTQQIEPHHFLVADYLAFFSVMFFAIGFTFLLLGFSSPWHPILLIYAAFGHGADAFCECGYTFSSTANGFPITYTTTDLIESDFIHVKEIFKDTDWRVQGYAVTAEDSRGPYGTNFTTSNVISNAVNDAMNWTGPGMLGGLPGLQLVVSGGTPSTAYINTAQVNSVRTDLLYGSYRFLANLPNMNGTCSAMFAYYNNSQETDMEALSSQFILNGTHLINLVQQTQASASRGYSIRGEDYIVASLPFDPTNGFHEYRFDIIPGRIDFYADQVLIGNMSSPPPVAGRHLILSHWSNGNALWSGGPPMQDAVLTIGYVKAYFNSSNPSRQSAALSRCLDPTAPGAYCPITDDPLVAGTLFSEFFFVQPNKTNNQTVYGKNTGSSVQEALLNPIISIVVVWAFFMMFL